jgi:hypothetical protein
MPPALRPGIQEEPAVVRPRPLARPREVPAADQADIRDGMMRGAKGAGRDQHRARTGEASGVVDAHDGGGFGVGIPGGIVVRPRAWTARVSRLPSLPWPGPAKLPQGAPHALAGAEPIHASPGVGWSQRHDRRAHPCMALMTSSTPATHAMRGNTRSLQVSCSCAVAAAQPSRTTTHS